MRNKELAILGGLALGLAGCGAETALAPSASEGSGEASPAPEAAGAARSLNRVLAFGDSLFAGYGLNDPARSYPARLEAALRQNGYEVTVANAGVSGDTTAAGRQRLAFTLDSQPSPPTLVLLELGGNDLLRGLPPAQTEANLAAMLDELKKRGIPVVLMGLQAPPNYGAAWQKEFDAIYPALAMKYGATLVPFVTEKVFADPAMLQRDRVHPTAKGVDVLVDATENAIAATLKK